MNHDCYLRIIRGETRSFSASAARLGLTAAEGPYRAAIALRNGLFNVGLRQPAHLGRPVISVGNLTAGGTGKTPMVIELARRLCEAGHQPAILLRGYGDDETRELQNAFAGNDPAVPVEANPNRAAQAADLLQRRADITVFVLDDAFQHRQVHRDLDLVLIDATQPFGHGHVLPRGLLREPIANLRRADVVIITRSDQVSADHRERLDARVEHITGQRPLAHTCATWRTLRSETGEWPLETLRKHRIAGACGIGNAQAFERQLREAAGDVVRMTARGDHHPWRAAELHTLLRDAAAAGADALVTTEKDWVKWQPLLEEPDQTSALPIWRPTLAIRFLDGEAPFVTLLEERIGISADARSPAT